MARQGEIRGLEKATLKVLSASDTMELDSDLSRVVSARKEPMIAEMIARNRDNIKLLVEAVNDNSKQGYGGLVSDGSELTLQWLVPNDFDKSTWQRWVGASGVQEEFIGGTTLEEEGLIIFGWMDRVSDPLVDAIKLYKGTEQSVVEPLAFRATKTFCCKAYDPTKATAAATLGLDMKCFFGGGAAETPIVEMRKALIVPPETDWHIDVKNTASGCDALQPLGFRVRTASAAWDLSPWNPPA